MRNQSILCLIFSLPLFLGTAEGALAMGKGVEAPRITKEEVKAMLGSPEVIILDVREASHWKESRQKIQGAVRENPEKEVQSWADKYPKDKTIILYCD